jgi:response regulator RpfG family c-di-GMP phosphodiesterase
MNAGDITVLLVDDEEMIRDCMTAYLEDDGFKVLCAMSGEEALKLIVVLTPTVCISDMRLPGMNGEEFINKAYRFCPDTRYILHTGMLYSLSDELRAIGMTDEDVLLKPIHDISKLARKIKLSVAAGRMNK